MIIAPGQVEADDVTARLLFPTARQGPWLPFERFAETMATSRKKAGLHPHQAEEVVVYVLEGYVGHEYDGGNYESLTDGSVVVLTAHEEIRHQLIMEKGRTARWLSIVLRVPWHTEPPPTLVVIRTAGEAVEGSDGTVQRSVVGPLARAEAFTGLEFTDITFAKEGTGFFRIGRDRRSVAYVLGGSGTIGGKHVEPGDGALLENAAGIGIHGSPGYRVALATVPRRAQD